MAWAIMTIFDIFGWRLLLAAVLLPVLGAAGQQAAETSSRVTLAQLRDRNRPLLIFAPTADDPRLLEQVRAINDHADEANDRDMVTVTVAEAAPAKGEFASGRWMEGRDATEARRRFHVKAGEFAVALVGKDGGEKLRASKPISFDKLRETIDAMPMRQEEMKSRR
jgi:hypothetical protein